MWNIGFGTTGMVVLAALAAVGLCALVVGAIRLVVWLFQHVAYV